MLFTINTKVVALITATVCAALSVIHTLADLIPLSYNFCKAGERCPGLTSVWVVVEVLPPRGILQKEREREMNQITPSEAFPWQSPSWPGNWQLEAQSTRREPGNPAADLQTGACAVFCWVVSFCHFEFKAY